MKIVVVPQLLRLVLIAALVAGCSSHPDRDVDRPENPFKANRDGPGGPKAPRSDKELRLEADQLYRRATTALTENDYPTAIERYNQLIARYPFSDYSTQAELEKVYAQYRNYQPDEAVSGADRFLREHPRHPHADYVQYVKGLTDSARDDSFTDFLPLDSTKKDVSNVRRAYDDFALLLQRYPNSPYGGDARRRMVYLRNRVADHELSVVKFYIKRGAFVAAAKRAENIIAEYPGAPATAEALKLLEQSDRRIGLTTEADEVAKLIAANPQVFAAAAEKPGRKKKAPVVVVAETDPGLPPTAPAPAPPKSWLARMISSLDFLDTSKPENSYTLVLPSATGAPTASAADGQSAPAASGTTPTASDGVAPVGKTVRLKATVEYGDNADGALPATGASSPTVAPTPATNAAPTQTAANAPRIDSTLSAPPVAAGGTKPAATPEPATTEPPKKRGFLVRFVDFFSFLDPNRNGSEKPTTSPAPTKTDNTGATVPATEPGK